MRRLAPLSPLLMAGSLAVLALAGPAVLAQEPSVQDVLAKAATATQQFTDPSRVIVCEERYKQTFSKLLYNTSGRVETKEISSREMVLELATVDTPTETPRGWPWMEFRDVLTVDKKPVRDGKSRLSILVDAPVLTTAVSQAWEYANDASGLQYGEMPRVALIPRTTMLFLHASNQPRFEFKKAGNKTFKGVKTIELKYQEKAAPTILLANSGAKTGKVSGSLWIDPVSGRLYQALIVSDDEPKLRDEMTIQFGEDKASGLWMPTEMKHKTDIGTTEEMVNGEAKFSNCRSIPRK